MMIYWTPLVGKQEIPGLLGEKMIYWTPLEIQKIFDIVGTKEEVLNLLLRNFFLISILSFIIFDLYFWNIFLYLFLIVLVFILTIFQIKKLRKI